MSEEILKVKVKTKKEFGGVRPDEWDSQMDYLFGRVVNVREYDEDYYEVISSAAMGEGGFLIGRDDFTILERKTPAKKDGKKEVKTDSEEMILKKVFDRDFVFIKRDEDGGYTTIFNEKLKDPIGMVGALSLAKNDLTQLIKKVAQE